MRTILHIKCDTEVESYFKLEGLQLILMPPIMVNRTWNRHYENSSGSCLVQQRHVSRLHERS